MADAVVNRRLNIYIDETAGAVALEKLTKKEMELVAAIEKGKKAGKDLTKEMNELAATQTRIGQLKDVMDGKLLPSIRQAEAAVSKLRRELKGLPADSEAAARKLQDLRRAEDTLNRVRQAANGVGKELKEISSGRGIGGILDVAAGAFLGGGLLGVVQGLGTGIQSFFQGAIDEALAAEEATARFEAQLDNLGRMDAFDRLTQAASELAEEIGYLDNDDIVGVFEQLINYGKLTETQIRELTPVIVDFAAKQRIELSEAASVVIKALEGNGKALKTYGIDMKDAKTVTEAFGLVMTDLKPKVDGLAKALGDNTAGQIKKTRQEIADLQEDVGTKVLPILKSFYQGVDGLLQGLRNIGRFFSDGTLFGGETEFGLRLRSRQDQIASLSEDFEKQTKERQIRLARAQILLVKDLNAQFKAASGQRKKELEQELKEETALLLRYQQIIRRQPDTRILGTGGNMDLKEGKGGSKPAKDTIKELRDNYTELANRVEENTRHILAAFRAINEQATKDIKTVSDALKAGIITPEQAQEAFDLIERVLLQQRESLQKKFGLQSTFASGIIDDNGNLDAQFAEDVKTGAGDLGAIIGRKIKQAVDEELNKEDNPIAAWIERYQEEIELGFQVVDGLTNAFLNLSQARQNAEEAELQNEISRNERRKESWKDMLDNKLISQQEYDKRVSRLDKQVEDRQRELQRRQFERDKNAQTAQALMSAAQAVVATLAARPGSLDIISLGAFRAIQLGIIAATTAAQVASIRSAKPPQFEDGGFIPQGSSHKQGGISLIDNRTGRNVGEVEGGEPIISRKTYARNKSLIDSLLAQGNGGMSLNIPRINNSFQRVFEQGGFIPRSGTDVGSTDLLNAVSTLNQILSNGIMANVIFGQYQAAEDRMNTIKSQSMIR